MPSAPKPRRPRRAPRDRAHGGRRRGGERLYTDFHFLGEMKRLQQAGGKRIQAHAEGNPISFVAHPRVFMTRKPLQGPNAPKPLVILTSSSNGKSRYYYAGRRSGNERRKGQEKRGLRNLGRTLFVAPSVTQKEFIRALRGRVFESDQKIESARLLGGLTAQTPHGQTLPIAQSYLYAERRKERRRGREKRAYWQDPVAEITKIVKMMTLVRAPGKAQEVMARLDPGLKRGELTGPVRIFRTARPVEGAKLMATLFGSNNPKAKRYIYFERRKERRQKAPQRFINYTLDRLLAFENKRAAHGPYKLSPAEGILPTTLINSMFESPRKLRRARLLATLRDVRGKPLYVYAERRGERRRAP